MFKLIEKYINKVIELTTVIVEDENGVEHKKTWTSREFRTSGFITAIIIIMLALIFIL